MSPTRRYAAAWQEIKFIWADLFNILHVREHMQPCAPSTPLPSGHACDRRQYLSTLTDPTPQNLPV